VGRRRATAVRWRLSVFGGRSVLNFIDKRSVRRWRWRRRRSGVRSGWFRAHVEVASV